jgi:hypothetical protein
VIDMPDRPNVDVRLAAVKLFFRHRLSLLPSKLRFKIPGTKIPATTPQIPNGFAASSRNSFYKKWSR